jgi:hypothetical protein
MRGDKASEGAARMLGNSLRRKRQNLSAPLTDQVVTMMQVALPSVSAVGAGEVILVVEDDPMMLKFTYSCLFEHSPTPKTQPT